jgi:membrane-associated phospholipid phosphatase
MLKKIYDLPEIKYILFPLFFMMTLLLSVNILYGKKNVLEIIKESVNLFYFLGGGTLVFAIVLICTMTLVFILVKKPKIEKIKDVIMSIFSFILFIGTMGVMISISIKTLFYLFNEKHVLWATLLLDKTEKFFFGDIVAINFLEIIKNIPLVEYLIIFSYVNVSIIFSLVIFLVSDDKNSIRKIISSFFISIIISLPMWTMIPAVSPDSLYFAKIFNNQNTETNFSIVNTNDNFKNTINFLRNIWVSEDNSFYSVSSFPSIHTAMGIISIYVLLNSRKRRILVWFLSLIMFFEIIGTFYLLQHYFLDTIMGIIVAILALKISEKIIISKDDHLDNISLYEFSDFLRKG